MTTPAWKSKLLPASFRNVKFFVSDTETVIGRRNVLHEYPLKDIPYAEDLGKKAREFTINAYVIGDDYTTQRDQLINAIENNSTPGVLVHPTLGIKNVVPTQCRVTFKNTEGGIEYFVLSFVEAGQNKYPSVSIDTQNNAQTVAANSINKVKNSFSSLFNVNGFSDTVASKASNALIGSVAGTGGSVTPVAASFSGTVNSILSKGAYLSNTAANFSMIKNQITALNNNASTLVADPATLATTITDIVSGLANAYPGNTQLQLNALVQVFEMYGPSLTPIPITTLAVPVATPTRIQESINQQQLIDLVGIASLIQMIISVSQTDFASRQDAIATMNRVENLIEPKLLYLADNAFDDSFNALNAARIAMVLDIKTRAATLKTIVYIKNNYPIPALVLAYKKYQDATQEADIVARNKISNPVFVPSGVNIEILI